MDFPMDFLVVLNLFKIITVLIFNLTNAVYSKDNLRKHICIIGRCLVRQRNP
jgi:hypothetical protein